MVGVADMGRGSRGKGLSDSAPVRDRRHRLLGAAAGEHPGPAIGTQWKRRRYRSRTSCRSIRWTRPSRTSRRSSTSWSSRFSTSTSSSDYTTGTTKGLIQVPGESIGGIIEPRVLQLDAAFSGPTYGGGVTLQGGAKVSDWRDLTAFVVADWNRTKTKLSFENETLIAHTKPVATVFSARVGLHGMSRPVHRRGDLDRCDVSAHPANGRGQRCRHGSPIHRGPVADETVEHAARWPTRVRQGLAPFLSRAGSALASRSSRRRCTGSDRVAPADHDSANIQVQPNPDPAGVFLEIAQAASLDALGQIRARGFEDPSPRSHATDDVARIRPHRFPRASQDRSAVAAPIRVTPEEAYRARESPQAEGRRSVAGSPAPARPVA